jgi:hypothetical protein
MGAAYTAQETADLVDKYNAGDGESVDSLAVLFNRTRKSIIAKLSKEGVYKKQEYLTKSGNKPEKKLSMVQDIEDIFNLRYMLLDKAPKATLNQLRNDVIRLHDAYVEQIERISELEEQVRILKEMHRET